LQTWWHLINNDESDEKNQAKLHSLLFFKASFAKHTHGKMIQRPWKDKMVQLQINPT